jgi:hypothetical protein
MSSLNLPLSGDVSQVIDPWTWCIRAFGSQLGLVNINLGKSSDPQLEEQILDDVGSYGRQLGQMGDALCVLLNHLDESKFTPDERMVVDAFLYQMKEISRLKRKRSAENREGSPAQARMRRQLTVGS